MKNFEEIMSERKNRIEARKDELIRRSLLSEEFLEMIQKNKRPFDLLMSYYQCAVMEIETKFRVLNQEYSLEYDKNPIEGIKTRIKSYDSIVRKIRRKNIPMSLTAIEENIKDIAGVRVICSFPEDIYELADSFLRQDDIVLIEKKDYIKKSKTQWLQKPASDRAGAYLSAEKQKNGKCGSPVSNYCHGFLGKSGT